VSVDITAHVAAIFTVGAFKLWSFSTHVRQMSTQAAFLLEDAIALRAWMLFLSRNQIKGL